MCLLAGYIFLREPGEFTVTLRTVNNDFHKTAVCDIDDPLIGRNLSQFPVVAVQYMNQSGKALPPV